MALGEAVQILIRLFLQMKTEIIICADLLIISPSSNRLPAGTYGAVKCQTSPKEKSNQHNTLQSSRFTLLCSSAKEFCFYSWFRVGKISYNVLMSTDI